MPTFFFQGKHLTFAAGWQAAYFPRTSEQASQSQRRNCGSSWGSFRFRFQWGFRILWGKLVIIRRIQFSPKPSRKPVGTPEGYQIKWKTYLNCMKNETSSSLAVMLSFLFLSFLQQNTAHKDDSHVEHLLRLFCWQQNPKHLSLFDTSILSHTFQHVWEESWRSLHSEIENSIWRNAWRVWKEHTQETE